MELIAQHRREQELAATRHVISPAGSSSSWSVDSETASNGGGDRCGGDRPPPEISGLVPSTEDSPRYAHTGENRIVRELREQQQRELELRGRWKEMGFVVPEEDSNHSETPFTLPQPIPENIQDASKQPGKLTSAFNRHGTHDLLNVTRGKSAAVQSNADNYAEDDDTRSSVISQDNGVDRQRFVYTPEDETPIEREIRLAKDREQALRLERGLPSGSSNVDELDNRRRYEVDVDLPTDNSNQQQQQLLAGHVIRQTEPGDKVTMKKLANGRLQMELNKEKQRELDLKNRGMIHTTSEDRIGKTVKYVDIIIERSGGNPTLEPPRTFRDAERARKSSNPLPEEAKPSVVMPVSHIQNPSRNFSKGRPFDLASTVEPELLQRFADKSSNFPDSNRDIGQLLKSKPVSRPSSTENKILRELQEMHMREEELRYLYVYLCVYVYLFMDVYWYV